jgi:hypothetical protein
MTLDELPKRFEPPVAGSCIAAGHDAELSCVGEWCFGAPPRRRLF